MLKRLVLNLKSNYFEYALYFLIASLFFGNAITSIACSIFYLTLFFIDFRQISFTQFTSVRPLMFMVLYLLVNFIILCFLANNFSEIFIIQKYLPFILVPLILESNKEVLNSIFFFNNVRKIFIIAAIFSFSLSFIYGLWRMFFLEPNINPIYITYSFLTDLFGVHQIYLSVFYMLAIIFCFDIYYEKNEASKKNYILFGIVLYVAIVLLSSRAIIVASFIVIFIKIFTLNKIKQLKVFVLITIFTGIILTISIPNLRDRVINLNQNISSYSGASFRFKIWENAIKLYSDSPIYGYGLGKSQEALLDQYHKVNFRRAYLKNFNVHNQYLQSLIDSGILGLISLLLMLFSPLFYIKRKSNLLVFTILILITLIPESFLIRQNGIIFFSLFFCIFVINRKD